MTERTYHHGDLQNALLAAAEAELAARGIEAFSLRAVARRAGVSHAAPAHHFGDAQGLLTALAVEAHRQLLRHMERRSAEAPPDPASRLVAAGIGYVEFARERPTLFRLIFSSSRPKSGDPDLARAGKATYSLLLDHVEAVGGGPEDVAAAWAIAHGFADLWVAGRLTALDALEPEARDAMLARLIRRVMP